MLTIDPSLILLEMDAPDSTAVIRALSSQLHALDLVAAEYGEATITREATHPTGLPTRPFCIAFPHADAEGVLQSALAVATLKNPVKFRNMADPDEELEVRIVFLLANRDPEEQVQALRRLALVFGQADKLVELRSLASPASAANWLERELLNVE
jgi:PTS system galactitol-specific IIA component